MIVIALDILLTIAVVFLLLSLAKFAFRKGREFQRRKNERGND